MKISEFLGNLIVVISFIFLLSSIIGITFNRPVLFSYAISESMEPTISSGDLFFINPFSKGGEGKIVVFEMGGMYVVHRVFAEENEAYITKGDNNLATDQLDGKYPPVKKDKVIGEVITAFGNPILIPKAGNLIDRLHSNSIFIAIALITLGFFSFTGESKKRKSKQKVRISAGIFYGLFSAILITSLVASTMLSWGEITFSYASTAAGGQREGWYLPGSEFEKSLVFQNRAYYPMIFFFEEKAGNGNLLSESQTYLNSGEEIKLDFSVSVPRETRIYSEGVEIYAYIPLLPLSVTGWLFDFSPYLPLLIQITLLSAFLLLAYRFSGFGEEYIVFRKRRFRL